MSRSRSNQRWWTEMSPGLVQFGIVIWLLSGASPAEGDRKQRPEQFGDLIEVSEVLLDVVVVGEDGLPKGGLGVDDFVVREDGQTVPVTGLSSYVTSYESLGTDEEATPWSRYVILMFHDTANGARYGRKYAQSQVEAGAQSQQWVMEEMLGGDWVAVVSYGRALRIHSDFSQDRFELARAIEVAAIDDPPRAEERGRRRQRRSRSGMIPSLSRNLPEIETPARDVHEALALLAESTGHLVGRKNLVLFSTGFGREIGPQRIAVADPLKYRRLESALNDNNIAVYPIDLTPGSARRDQRAFLDRLAFDTGGLYFDGVDGFEDALHKVGTANTRYYLLSYQTEHSAGDIGYQRVSVTTTDPSLRVLARTGYRYGL